MTEVGVSLPSPRKSWGAIHSGVSFMTFSMNVFCTRPTQDTWRLCFFVSFIFHKSENKKKYTVRYLPGENNNFTIVKPKEDDKRTLVRNFVSIKIFFRLLSFEDCILGSNLGSRRGSNLGSILGSAATVDGIGLEKISKKEKTDARSKYTVNRPLMHGMDDIVCLDQMLNNDGGFSGWPVREELPP